MKLNDRIKELLRTFQLASALIRAVHLASFVAKRMRVAADGTGGISAFSVGGNFQTFLLHN